MGDLILEKMFDYNGNRISFKSEKGINIFDNLLNIS